MSVAYVTHANNTNGLGSTASSTTVTVAVSGANPHVSIEIGLVSGSATITSITSDQSTGTIVQTAVSNNSNVKAFIWSVPAPAVATHTFTINFSASVNYNVVAKVFSGADQTTPQPSGDAQTSTSNTSAVTLTPTNLTANDATTMVGCNDAGNWSSATPNQRVQDNGSFAGLQSGDSTGTTGTTFAFSGIGASDIAMVAVRIAAASGGGGSANNQLAWITA